MHARMQGSRTHYCCHPTVSKKKNVDEECDKLMEDDACKYFQNTRALFMLKGSSSLQVRLCTHTVPPLLNALPSMHACPCTVFAFVLVPVAEPVLNPYSTVYDVHGRCTTSRTCAGSAAAPKRAPTLHPGSLQVC